MTLFKGNYGSSLLLLFSILVRVFYGRFLTIYQLQIFKKLQTTSFKQVYSGNGDLVADFSKERNFVPYGLFLKCN